MISRTVCDDHAAEQMPTTSRVGRYRKHNSVATGASQHRTVAKGGRVVVLSRTPLALLFVCSTAPLSSQPAVVSGERGTEHDGDWPEAEGWLGRRDEMSGEVEIAFFSPVRMRLGVFLLYWRAPRVIKKKSKRKRAGASWWSCSLARTNKGTPNITSKRPQEVGERENPSFLKRPYPRAL